MSVRRRLIDTLPVRAGRIRHFPAGAAVRAGRRRIRDAAQSGQPGTDLYEPGRGTLALKKSRAGSLRAAVAPGAGR